MVLQTDHACNAEHGTTSTEYSLFGDILSAAALASAGYSAYKALDIAQKEWEMANKYYDLAKAWLDYYNDHFAPVEDQEIEEALALEYVEPSYKTARGRGRASAWITFKGKLRDTMKCTSRYCTGLRNDMLVQISKSQADAVSLADGLAYRNERAYTESRNDVLFARKLETAKRGRSLVAESPSMAKSAANIYGDLWNQTWAGLEGAGQYLGYVGNRNEPIYPRTGMAVAGNMGSGSYNERVQTSASGRNSLGMTHADYRDLVARRDARNTW